MSNTINADDGIISGIAGLKYSADTSGALVLQTNGTTAITISASQAVSFTGAVTFASASFTNLSYTGTFTGGTGVVNLGSGQFYKDASGNSGFGTTTTTYRLNVSDTNSRVWNKSFATGHAILHNENDGGSFYFAIDNSTGTAFGSGNYARVISSTGAYPIAFQTNSAERMRIDSSGNVGIGTSSPTDTLTIGPNATANYQIRVNGAVTPSYFGAYQSQGYFGVNRRAIDGAIVNSSYGAAFIAQISDTSGSYMSFNTGTAANTQPIERIRLDYAGNIGIGVIPSAWQSVYKAIEIGTTGSVVNDNNFGMIKVGNNYYVNSSGQYIYKYTGLASLYNQYAGVHTWSTAQSGSAGAVATFTDCMSISSAGNLLVGVSAGSSRITMTQTNGEITHIGNGNTAVDGGSPWFATGNSYTWSTATYGWSFYDSDSDGSLQIYRRAGSTTGSLVMRMDRANGAVTTPAQPAFFVYPSASSTATTVPFNTAVFNIGSCFNTGTYTFTAPVAGIYWFNLIISYNSGTAPTLVTLYKNGARERDMFEANTWAVNTEYHASTIMYLNTGDAITVYNNGNGDIQGGALSAQYYSAFQGYLVG